MPDHPPIPNAGQRHETASTDPSGAVAGLDSVASLDPAGALARRVLANESNAFAALMQHCHGFVFAICFNILGHRQDAEDATQDTFSRVAKYLHRWDPGRPFKPWLARVAGNRSRTQLAKRKSHTSLEAIADPHGQSGEQVSDARAIGEEICRAVSNLRPRQRDAFECFHIQGMSYDEIAKHLQCPLGTAKTLVRRARLAVTDQLISRDVVAGQRNSAEHLPNSHRESMNR
ncbi:ECF RNA polymerase sigma factor SigE [Stieleria bergensis]|uniref:ECF RNA polymerase sigma factor SigE n=1 Tax=Stieleria bergensis TaxID=2528025 RepID=A0A517SPN8_9BACT|nr:ECF RNA polymerase sigma factor SigE [Planctomycetes bacterium SV_7m_r]